MDSIKTIKIGICNTCGNNFSDFLSEHIVKNIEQTKSAASSRSTKSFSVGIEEIESNNYSMACNYNYIFYVVGFNDIANKIPKIIKNITDITSEINTDRNFLFIVVDECVDMEMPDDELCFRDKNKNDIYQNFINKISSSIDPDFFNCFKLSTSDILLGISLSNNSDMKNMPDDDIKLLGRRILSKSVSKMSISDIKTQIKKALKKKEINSYLEEFGYYEILDKVQEFMEISRQKRLIYHNYINYTNKFEILFTNENNNSLKLLIGDVSNIKFLSKDIHKKLISDINDIIYHKIVTILKYQLDTLALEKTKDTSAILNFNFDLEQLKKVFDVDNCNNEKIFKLITSHCQTINQIVIDIQQKELGQITDLNKLLTFIEKSNSTMGLESIVRKILSNPTLIYENVDKPDKWLFIVNKCVQLSINEVLFLNLVEEIIINKINYFTDVLRNNVKDFSIIYPQCLQIYLLKNINSHFVYAKLYMYLQYVLRYSGKNIAEFVRKINETQFNEMLDLEIKLFSHCKILTGFVEYSPVSHTEKKKSPIPIEIVESYNDTNPCHNEINDNNPQKIVTSDKAKSTIYKKSLMTITEHKNNAPVDKRSTIAVTTEANKKACSSKKSNNPAEESVKKSIKPTVDSNSTEESAKKSRGKKTIKSTTESDASSTEESAGKLRGKKSIKPTTESDSRSAEETTKKKTPSSKKSTNTVAQTEKSVKQNPTDKKAADKKAADKKAADKKLSKISTEESFGSTSTPEKESSKPKSSKKLTKAESDSQSTSTPAKESRKPKSKSSKKLTKAESDSDSQSTSTPAKESPKPKSKSKSNSGKKLTKVESNSKSASSSESPRKSSVHPSKTAKTVPTNNNKKTLKTTTESGSESKTSQDASENTSPDASENTSDRKNVSKSIQKKPVAKIVPKKVSSKK